MIKKIDGEYYIKASKMLNWLYDKCGTEQAISDSYRDAYTRELMGRKDGNNGEYQLFKERCFIANALAQVYSDIYDMIVKETARCD